MTDARIAVVAEALAEHSQHSRSAIVLSMAQSVIAALDAYAAIVPQSGRIPPVDESWGNKAHPHGAVGAPGAVRPVGAWARSGELTDGEVK